MRRAEPAPNRFQTLVDEWLAFSEFNYRLNPLHPDFSKLRIHDPVKLPIAKRLANSRPPPADYVSRSECPLSHPHPCWPSTR